MGSRKRAKRQGPEISIGSFRPAVLERLLPAQEIEAIARVVLGAGTRCSPRHPFVSRPRADRPFHQPGFASVLGSERFPID